MAQQGDGIPTQNADEADSVEEFSDEDENASGFLIPMSRCFRRFPLSADESEWTVGRHNDSDYNLTEDYSAPDDRASSESHERFLKLYSKLQFRLSKEIVKGDVLFFVNDESANGTFVDGVKIGKGKRALLKVGAVISIAVPQNRAFLFREKTVTISGLPEQFSEKYTMAHELGRGACGSVRLCFAKDYGPQRFAVKIFDKHIPDSVFDSEIAPAGAAAHNNEADILRSIDHPNIVKIYDVYENNQKALIVLELVDGGDLFPWISRINELPPPDRCPRVKIIFAQLVLAVKCLHDRGISHRDLKPENVLVTGEMPNLIVKITDFGLSKKMSNTTVLKTFCGTPAYFAPEIIESNTNGGHGYTEAVDCWSLGVVLFLLLAGYPPFSPDYKDVTLAEQIRKGKARIFESCWSGVDEAAKKLVLQLLEKDVHARLNINQVWEHEWLQDPSMKKSLKRLIPTLAFPTAKRNRDRAFSTSPIPAVLKRIEQNHV